MAETIFARPRKARKKADFVPYTTPQLHEPFPLLPDHTSSGEPNLFGIIKDITLTIQNNRRWFPSTCKTASSLTEKYLYQKFPNTPFTNITEENLRDLLVEFDKDNIPYSTKRRLIFLVKLIFQTAFDMGLTSTTLWGIPEWFSVKEDPFTSSKNYEEEKKELLSKKQKRKIDQIFGTGRSVSIEAELNLLVDMLCSSQSQGEMIAGLLIWINGLRTSEACNPKFKHFREIAPGILSITRSDIGDSVSGKSSNASRHAFLPYFMASFIKNRIAHLQSLGFIDSDIQEMYIPCPGQEYTSKDTISPTELNRKLKAVYYRAGVSEDMMAQAYSAVAESKDVREHCDGSSSAYLGRHQAATEFFAVGLSLNDCGLIVGHAKTEGVHRKTDFARPDIASEIYCKLSFRPAILILDAAFRAAESSGRQLFERGGVNQVELEKQLLSLDLTSKQTFSYPDIFSSTHSDLPADISFNSQGPFSITVIPDSPNQEVTFSPTNIADLVVTQSNFPVLRSVSEYTPMHKAMTDIAITVLESYQRKRIKLLDRSAIAPPPAIPNDLLDSLIDTSVDVATVPDGQAVIDLESPSPNGSEVPLQHRVASPFLLALPSPTQKEEASPCLLHSPELPESTITPTSPNPSAQGKTSSNGSTTSRLYLRSSRGLLLIDPSFIIKGMPGRNGIKHPWIKPNTEVYGFVQHNPALALYVISRDSTTFKIPPCKDLTDYVNDHKDSPACKALLSGGFPLQSPSINSLGCDILCLAQDGSIRLISSSALTRLEKGYPSIKLFSTSDTQHIISACCLSSVDEPILLTATNGDVLRFPANSLHAVKAPGAQLVRGMSLEANTHALTCLASSQADLITVSPDGKAHRVSLDTIPSKAPGRKNTQLIACTSLAAVTIASESSTILLCTSAGYLHCIDSSSVPAKTDLGVQAITFRAGSTALVVDAISSSIIS